MTGELPSSWAQNIAWQIADAYANANASCVEAIAEALQAENDRVVKVLLDEAASLEKTAEKFMSEPAAAHSYLIRATLCRDLAEQVWRKDEKGC